MKSIDAIKKEFVKHCKDISAKDMSWGASGNFSMRVDAKRFLVSASGSHFARMTQKNISTCGFKDMSVVGPRPSVEHNMHRAIYTMRPDVRSIVHVHPLYSVLMISAEDVEMNYDVIPEAGHYLGKVVSVPYIAAGTERLAKAVEKKVRDATIIILKNHGIVALGKDFQAALCAVEAFEFIAKMNYYAHLAKLKLPKLS